MKNLNSLFASLLRPMLALLVANCLALTATAETAPVSGSVYRIPEDPAFNHLCRSDGGVLEGECRALLEDFFRRRRSGD